MISKLANAQFANVRVRGVESVDPTRVLKGGLWVGGRITFDGTVLVFRPNQMNRSVHATSAGSLRSGVDIPEPVIPVSAIETVQVVGGLVTKIVEVTGDGGRVLRFRCYGARKVAAAIEDAVAMYRATGRGASGTTIGS